MKTKTELIAWSELKPKLVRLHPTLTKADLIWRHGTTNEMVEMISSKLGLTVRELIEETEKV
ncbi:MAG: hypothetical protein RBR40_10835 [Tenuifilaceae bacterium]|nr:hypothetical protein [Tenuifilaceae bacterium]